MTNSYRYYLATSEADSAQQHLYRVSTRDSRYKSDCLSCNVRRGTDQGTYCLYNTASFSTNNGHYILTCAGPGVPDISIYSSRVRIFLFVTLNSLLFDLVA